MELNLLQSLLVTQLFAVLILFSRLGAALMLFPVFGESFVNPRTRLLLALALSVMLAPFMEMYLPPLPKDPLHLTFLLAGEITIGAFIGIVARLLLNVTHVGGMIISYQSSLSLATQFDNTQASQGSIVGNFLTMSGLLLILSFDLHHMMLRGVVDSYTILPSTQFPPMEDISNYVAQLIAYVFRVGVQIAAPSIVVGLLMYLSAGLIARLMPNMQIFFVMMPFQLWISIFLLMATFHSMMEVFIAFFSSTFADFLEGI
jgi:flagellar biosynthetic protein FliR